MHTQIQKDDRKVAKKAEDVRYENHTQDNHNSGAKSVEQEAGFDVSVNHVMQMQSQGQLAMQFDGLPEKVQAQENTAQPIQRKVNNTGLPDNLKAGIENLSGYSMDDVNVHYNSSKPAQFQAHAYAQGTDIHLAPRQEKHLPHEAWHVLQQKQGRVKPTIQLKGKVNVNDNAGLEREADVMGKLSETMTTMQSDALAVSTGRAVPTRHVVQRVDYSEALTAVLGKVAEIEEEESSNTSVSAVMRASWLDLQKEIEHWKFSNWDEYLDVFNRKIFAFGGNTYKYSEFVAFITSKIVGHTDADLDDGALKYGSASELCDEMEQEFQDLALRIAVQNAPKYIKQGFASPYAFAKAQRVLSTDGNADPNVPADFQPIPPTLSGTKPAALRRSAAAVDHNRMAVCSSFAAAVAHKLIAKGCELRIEIMGSSKQNHNFVVLGREPLANLKDPDTWGDDCRIIDCWWGAIKMDENTLPKILYTAHEHITTHGNVPSDVFFDSFR